MLSMKKSKLQTASCSLIRVVRVVALLKRVPPSNNKVRSKARKLNKNLLNKSILVQKRLKKHASISMMVLRLRKVQQKLLKFKNLIHLLYKKSKIMLSHVQF
jgi:hypothetical protein